jgi:hypothetical protein
MIKLKPGERDGLNHFGAALDQALPFTTVATGHHGRASVTKEIRKLIIPKVSAPHRIRKAVPERMKGQCPIPCAL